MPTKGEMIDGGRGGPGEPRLGRLLTKRSLATIGARVCACRPPRTVMNRVQSVTLTTAKAVATMPSIASLPDAAVIIASFHVHLSSRQSCWPVEWPRAQPHYCLTVRDRSNR